MKKRYGTGISNNVSTMEKVSPQTMLADTVLRSSRVASRKGQTPTGGRITPARRGRGKNRWEAKQIVA